MTTINSRRSPNDAGYALVELLVSLSILALLLAMVPSTLQLGKRAWETSSRANETQETEALVFLQRNLPNALPLFERDSNSLQRIAFAGADHELTFIAELQTGPAGGGLYEIAIRSGGSQPSLSLAPYRANAKAAPAETRDLSLSYSALALKYFGPKTPGAKPEWQAEWSEPDRLPDLIDIVASPRNGSTTKEFSARVELKLRPAL
jgi:general secretion pathway protein J